MPRPCVRPAARVRSFAHSANSIQTQWKFSPWEGSSLTSLPPLQPCSRSPTKSTIRWRFAVCSGTALLERGKSLIIIRMYSIDSLEAIFQWNKPHQSMQINSFNWVLNRLNTTTIRCCWWEDVCSPWIGTHASAIRSRQQPTPTPFHSKRMRQ